MSETPYRMFINVSLLIVVSICLIVSVLWKKMVSALVGILLG